MVENLPQSRRRGQTKGTKRKNWEQRLGFGAKKRFFQKNNGEKILRLPALWVKIGKIKCHTIYFDKEKRRMCKC